MSWAACRRSARNASRTAPPAANREMSTSGSDVANGSPTLVVMSFLLVRDLDGQGTPPARPHPGDRDTILTEMVSNEQDTRPEREDDHPAQPLPFLRVAASRLNQ